MADLVLALDQGTTSSRALLFDDAGRVRGLGQHEFAQHYPAAGFVEHDAEQIWDTTRAAVRDALAAAGARASDVACAGVTNQRETVVLWERATGRPLHRAIVWQDRRTADACDALARSGHLPLVTARTGLLLDPYFSASKIAWLLDHVPGARARAEAGELAVGTIDTFLLWRLTGGATHATDATNASRTSLFDIHRQGWDDELLALFGVPRALLPDVRDSASDFGAIDAALFGGAIPLTGVAGDQQAAALGQACWTPGSSKCTYGTGGFLLLNTGADVVASHKRLLSTVAYRLAGRTSYALEGSFFSAGSAIQWLRDGLRLLARASDSAEMAARSDLSRAVHLVPAFTGLGAPHWDARARGALVGLTRDVTADDVVRAALEASAFQTAELLDAMRDDGCPPPAALRIDGGMAANDWFAQRLADLLGLPVERPKVTETTALGAALLARLGAGVAADPDELAKRWQLDRRFVPMMSEDERATRRAGWRAAVRSVLTGPRA
ncbi:MAG: glycerol kinase GlpK [Planctomycetes bacterium]|nr:glycerol kinase GlpK [Planctomycetota bacterium]